MRDSLYDDVAARLGFAPAVRTAAATVAGPAVDMSGNRNNFRVAMLVTVSGVITDGTHTVGIEESANGSTGWTAAPTEALQGAPPVLVAANSSTSSRLGYVGASRYIRATITTAGATAGGLTGAVFLLAQGSGRPVT